MLREVAAYVRGTTSGICGLPAPCQLCFNGSSWVPRKNNNKQGKLCLSRKLNARLKGQVACESFRLNHTQLIGRVEIKHYIRTQHHCFLTKDTNLGHS